MAERVQSQPRVDLFGHPFYIRREKVDLIDDRDDCQIIFHGQIKIGNRLSLHALRSIDQKKPAFARCQGAGNLIRKVDMTWRVDQIENILLSVSGVIGKRNGLTLDGDPPLALDVHVIQDLILEVSLINQTRILNEAVCKGRFSMVNVCDDAEVTYVFHGFILKSWFFLKVVLKDLGNLSEKLTYLIINYFLPKIPLSFLRHRLIPLSPHPSQKNGAWLEVNT